MVATTLRSGDPASVPQEGLPPLQPDRESGATSGLPPEILDRPEKPATDDQQYRAVRLANGMRVLLVHDAQADKAAAAVDVRPPPGPSCTGRNACSGAKALHVTGIA